MPRWLIGVNTERDAFTVALQLLALLALIVAGAMLVYSTGGLPNANAHVLYVPILLGAYCFGLVGAIGTSVLCGILLGPVSGMEFMPGQAQTTAAWLTRLGFFIAIGVVATAMLSSRNRNRARLKTSIRELYQAYGKSLQTFASLVALRDEQTAHHCERVAHNACIVGEALGLTEHELTELNWAGILHDLGKISTPPRILLKPGSLTDSEFAEIKKHANVGADILAGISPRFLNIADGVRSHHERWDGTGYPRALAGDDIPLAGRILAIADVFEAVTSQRPYRDPITQAQALDILRSGAGTHFDPGLVDVFLSQYDRGCILVEGDPIPQTGLAERPLPGFATLAEEAELG